MLVSLITRIVEFSHRFALAIIFLALLMSVGLGWYVSEHFEMNTDINQLIAEDLEWRIKEKQIHKGFPQKSDLLVIVIDGENPDVADHAADVLTAKLRAMPQLFSEVKRPDRIPFFVKNGLLLLSKEESSDMLNQMIQAQPVLGVLAQDPSLRGFFGMVELMLEGVARGETDFKQLDAPLNSLAATLEANLAGQNKILAWQGMGEADKPPSLHDLRKLVLAKPVLDFTALQPGEAASTAIRNLVKELGLESQGVKVRLTGDVALNDEEFASVSEDTGFATALSGLLVLGILLLALRSLRIVIPILLTLIAGLIATTAFALVTIGSLNLISVAFAVMFIGIAVDFGIQFGVRYRDQHHEEPDHTKAMIRTAKIIALPLTMAAGSTTLGFFAFIPTAYRGVSELGLIAGAGMLIAFVLNLTLLPAFLRFTKPPAEMEAVGYRWAAPIDTFIETHRKKILWTGLVIALFGSALASQVRFDFDPLNLKNMETESVSTLFDAMKDPDFSVYMIDILRPSLQDAKNLAEQLEKLPEVDHVLSLNSFVPEDQEEKLMAIDDANMIFASTLNPSPIATPTDAEIIDSLKKLAEKLRAAPNHPASVERLATALDNIVQRNDAELLKRLHNNLVAVMQSKLDLIKQSLSAETITADNITEDLRRDWVTADGQYLLQVYPKGNPRDYKTLIAFTDAVRKIAPDATGTPITIQESANTISGAFIYAGIYALLTIALLSFLILRRLLDVIYLMTPLVLAGISTLATMVLIQLPLNFANVIALPLLLSLGVSYAIYFVSYARAGLTNPLQSSMARAVLFSAATTLVAFGSLSMSSHTGTSGMGKLLVIALIYSLMCSFVLLPALLSKKS